MQVKKKKITSEQTYLELCSSVALPDSPNRDPSPIYCKGKKKKNTANLFFSTPIRNAPSASAARRLPLPASFPVTAYSLTKA